MAGDVWVIAEQRLGRLMDVSLQLLGKGKELERELGVGLCAALVGEQLELAAGELLAYGAERVYVVEDPRLRFYQSDAYARLLADLLRDNSPEIVLFGATTTGRELASRVAGKLGTGLTAHGVALSIEEVEGKRQLVCAVPGWGGNLMVRIVCPQRRPQIATVKPGVLSRPERGGGGGEVIRVQADIREEDFRALTVEMVEERPCGVPVEGAEVVVAGGWGLCSVGDFGPVEELARLLGGVVGGTRPTLDKGWIGEECLIGQSGKTVSPRLFISIGASGAMHFTTGFLKSGVVLAIDQNPRAPIFEVADIGIVGDLREVLPCLIEELKAAGIVPC